MVPHFAIRRRANVVPPRDVIRPPADTAALPPSLPTPTPYPRCRGRGGTSDRRETLVIWHDLGLRHTSGREIS
jgi:hypothetical protein